MKNFFDECLCFYFIVGGSMRQILQVMNSRMRMNFSFPCLMESTKRWRKIGGNPRVKVNCFPLLIPFCWFYLLNASLRRWNVYL